MVHLARISFLIVSAALFMGNVIGFVQGRDKTRRLIGLSSAILLTMAYFVSFPHFRTSLLFGDLICLVIFCIGKTYLPEGRLLESKLYMLLSLAGMIVFSLAFVVFMLKL